MFVVVDIILICKVDSLTNKWQQDEVDHHASRDNQATHISTIIKVKGSCILFETMNLSLSLCLSVFFSAN